MRFLNADQLTAISQQSQSLAQSAHVIAEIRGLQLMLNALVLGRAIIAPVTHIEEITPNAECNQYAGFTREQRDYGVYDSSNDDCRRTAVGANQGGGYPGNRGIYAKVGGTDEQTNGCKLPRSFRNGRLPK